MENVHKENLTKKIEELYLKGIAANEITNEIFNIDQESSETYFNGGDLDISLFETKKFVNKIIETLKPKKSQFTSKIEDCRAPTGITKLFYDEILAQAPRPNPIFAMAGAISLMSAFCSGRFRFNKVWPSLFSLVIGEKSSGKNAPLDFCSQVLTHPKIRPYNLLGQGTHNSKQSLILSLPEQRVRLDLIDEYSGFLHNYTRESSYARDTAMELTKIWSLNGRWYPGIKSVSRGSDTGECYGPAINVMALIQPEPFAEIATRDMIETGYLSRFLFFYSNEILETNQNPEFLFEDRSIDLIADEIKRLLPVPFLNQDITGQSHSNSRGMLKPTAEAIIIPSALRNDIQQAWDVINKKQLKGEPVDRMLYSKAFEQIMKLIIIKVIGDDKREACYDDLDWAYSLVETLISNSRNFIQVASGGNRYEKLLESVRTYVKEKELVSKNDFTRRFQRYLRYDRDSVIQDLLDCEQIEIQDFGSTRYYKWTDLKS